MSAEPGAHPPSEPFVWRDAGRTIVFRDTGLRDAPELLAEYGFESFELFTTERAAGDIELLREGAAGVHLVPAGQVPDTAAGLLDRAERALERASRAGVGTFVVETAVDEARD